MSPCHYLLLDKMDLRLSSIVLMSPPVCVISAHPSETAAATATATAAEPSSQHPGEEEEANSTTSDANNADEESASHIRRTLRHGQTLTGTSRHPARIYLTGRRLTGLFQFELSTDY